MVESTSSLPKCSRRCAARCADGRGNPLTNSLLSRRRRHKTVHFGDLTERLGAYCTDIPNCCKLSSMCRNGGDASRSCPMCSGTDVSNSGRGLSTLQQGWSSLETIQTALDDDLKFDDGKAGSFKSASALSGASCESNNPSCKICRQQSLVRRRKRAVDSGRKRKARSDAECSKSLPNELEYEPNVQELFTFIESVLSSWFVEDGAYTSQGESENDDKSKGLERESGGEDGEASDRKRDTDGDDGDEGDDDDDEDVFQITIEKQKKRDKRKGRKGDDKEFKEKSYELSYGNDPAEIRNDANLNNNNNNSNNGNESENATNKQLMARKPRRGSKSRVETEYGRLNSKIRELVLRVNGIPDGSTRFRHNHWAITVERCNYVFLRKMSDEDRMSLTTAISDEEDGESLHNSPFKGKQTGSAAASFNCTGAVRKAGFLSVKKWLLRKKHQIELARKRGWKGYWVCLKGTTLLFYPCDSREGRTVEAAPKHLIIVDGAIMQPIPEHPKRDYIFCLSTAFGDAYLFQAPCQVELENWVNSIHCACAAAFARHRGKTGTLHLLQEEIFRLEKAIESDHKLKHMADLQQSVVSDSDTKQQIHAQILQWEENLERLHCEQFRLRCYMASLHNGELPNPKSLLTHVSRVTKNTLNKLGVFTVSSFHAFICARSPSLLNNLLAGRGATKRRTPMLSRSNSGSSRRGLQNSKDESESGIKVTVPDNQTTYVPLREMESVEDFLACACYKKGLNPMEHFIRVKKRHDMEDQNYFVPHRMDLIQSYLQTHEVVEVCAKILYQVELQRTNLDQMWGFSVEAELIENSEKQDELCCYVSRVEDRSYAMQKGIIKGDEIMVINGAIVSDLDMMYLESVLQEEHALCMMMRSSRTEPPDQGDLEDLGIVPGMMRSTDAMIQSLVCPPPPSEPPTMSEEMITGLIVPAPAWSKELYSPEEQDNAMAEAADAQKATSRTNSFEIENLLKTAEQVTGICRSPQETRKSSPTESVVSQQSQAFFPQGGHLTHAEKLRKVILELVDTERAYVEHLNRLLENYLEPLKRETFLSNAEVDALFGNIQEIVTFQRAFLQNLEESVETEPEFHEFTHPSQFKKILFSIGSAFLYYVNHFKLYSSFCASHSKVQKIFHPNEGNHALRQFLAARNPKQQHSSTLESYLIKPIQRILKYPLLLQQLRNLTDPQSTQHQHLVEALKGMEKVAEHINEMQRIHEEYGAIFDHLFRQHQKSCKQIVDLNPADLLYYGGVEWLNISDFLGKIKKGLELHAMCFVFKSAVVFLCKERLRQKKKIMGVSSKSTATEVEIIRYQVLIPVTEVQVRASTAKDGEAHYLWELIHLKSQFHRRSEKTYVLSNSTGDFRNAFLKTIRQIIRESVRNMSIPGAKTGPSGFNGSVSMPKPPPRDFSISSKGSTSSEDQESTQRPYLPPQPSVQQLQQLPHKQSHSRHSSQTLKLRKPKPPQRHSAAAVEQDTTDGEDGNVVAFRSRSKTVSDTQDGSQMEKSKSDIDPGTKSEGEDDSQSGTTSRKKTLGKTPNHLTLSTTSTLSAGSTGSQAKLIQSSQHPENYQPSQVRDLGSPVWKPRDSAAFGEATTLPRHKGKAGSSAAEASADRHSTPQGHGTTTRPGRSRKSIADVMMHEK